MEHGLPLVGRDNELRAVESALADNGRGMLIAGMAGVGKSRLAREAAARATVRGHRVLTARASGSGAGLALAALAGMLGDDPGLDGPVMRGLRGLRRLAAAATSTVLFVDDAHLLDEVSATVIHQLVAEGSITVLATVRTGERAPDAVTALWKDLGVARIDLGALSAPDSDALVTAIVGGPVEGQTLRRVRDVAAGNPLFLRELLTSAREAGILAQATGVWRLTGSLVNAPRLIELLRTRLAATDGDDRDAVEVLAIGEPVPLAVAELLIGERGLEGLERRGLVAVSIVGNTRSVRLSHPLYGELLRAEVPELARIRHSRRLADALEELGTGTGEDAMRVALWRLDGGGTVNPELMLMAAEQAALIREYALTERLSATAYEAGGGIRAGLATARARFRLGRLGDALALCATLAGRAGADSERTQVAIQHAAILAHGADDVLAGLAVLDAVAVSDLASREQLNVFRLYLRAYQLDCLVLEEAMTAFRTAESIEARLAASSAAGGAFMLAGRFADAAALVNQVLPLVAQNFGPGQVQSDSMPAAIGHMRCDLPDPAGALALSQAAFEASLHPPDRVGQALNAFALAKIALAQGRPTTALRWANEASLIGAEMNLKPVARWAAGLRMQAAAHLGDVVEVPPGVRGGPHTVWLFDIEIARGLAWRAAVQGDADGAREPLIEAVTRHGERGAVGAGTLGALDLVRLGEASLAKSLLESFPPPEGWELGRLTVDYATAAASGDPASLLAVAQSFSGYGMPLHAAEAASVAASEWRAAGDPRAAERAHLFASTQLLLCEKANTPALRLVGPAAGLTGREREIALAAAQGEPTGAIAARLRVSERTAENHLYRAYTKLGVTGRAELRGVLALD